MVMVMVMVPVQDNHFAGTRPGLCKTGGDCDDANPAIHPGAAEICDNGIDENCNGQVDENCNGAPAHYYK